MICISIKVNGQKLLLDVLPMIDSRVVYKNVLEVQGKPKLKLENDALIWFDQLHMTVIENRSLDASHQLISGTYKFKAMWGPNDFQELYKTVECKVILTLRSERYQYEFSGFTVSTPEQAVQLEIYQTDNKLRKYNKEFYKRIDQEIQILLNSMKQTLGQ
jgi:hypothetical protein